MNLLLDLEIDLACAEFLRARGYSVAQPVIIMLDQADELDEALAAAAGESSPLKEDQPWHRLARAVNDLGIT